ncbi:hypothetical protein [Anaeromicropila herbilytica]|uniref:Uncharacterized protein n=1 Tax=Anaeromicropila herbilytica TaxID=2785025 RepID=A0A7R7EM33_9FIRM|nr:hypothetical protein [Anaeromicropila herbilytica]BCN31258.1 hypothetical protein bsdtb5_25530 [Anaeromicropila herbilytica]
MIRGEREFKNKNGKAVAIFLLYISALMIMFSGAFYSFYSVINHITLKVISSEISGAVFGILVLYLGIRYYIAVLKLRVDV